MTIYYVTIFGLTGLGYLLTEKKCSTRTRDLYFLLAFIVLVFFTSFRYAIGFDYFSYRLIYEMVETEWTLDVIFHDFWYEPGFFLIYKFFQLLHFSYPAALAGINIFLMAVSVWFVRRYSKMPWVSIYLYITFQFLAYHMNLVRQSIALCFFLFAYPFLKEKKIIPFTLLLLIGGLLHNSLWFVWPLYFLLTKKPTIRYWVFTAGAALLVYILFDALFVYIKPYLPMKYAAYLGTYFWNANTFLYVVPAILYGVLLFLFRRRITDPTARTIYLNSAFYNILISFYITKHFILERFAVYPFVFSLIAVPDIIASYRSEKKRGKRERTMYRFVLILWLLFGAGYFLFAAANGFHQVYPYVSLLERGYSVPSMP